MKQIRFESVRDLIGKVVRRTAPSASGDYSFMMNCGRVQSVDEHNIVLKNMHGGIVSLSTKDYDDDNWVQTRHNFSSYEIAELYGLVRKHQEQAAREPGC